MIKWTYTPLLLLALGFFGCTPFSEQIVKKGDDSTPNRLQEGLVRGQTLDTAEVGLDLPSRMIIRRYGRSIREYSSLYRFDWRLILAVMKQESRFSTVATSKRGASGLMQIMPSTGEEVARLLDIDDMSHPVQNIRAGIYYLSTLYNRFEGSDESDRVRLTLAAYNAGIARIYDAQDLAAYLNDNPTRWECIRDALPLLSRRYNSLHNSVWSQQKPRSGWFGRASQTVAYVDNIMEYYDGYRLLLN